MAYREGTDPPDERRYLRPGFHFSIPLLTFPAPQHYGEYFLFAPPAFEDIAAFPPDFVALHHLNRRLAPYDSGQ